MKRVSILFLMGMLAACSAPTGSEAASVTESSPAEAPVHSVSGAAPGNQSVPSTKVVLTQHCAEAALQLSCATLAGASETLDCRSTSLSLEAADGQSSKIEKPAEMADYTAVGIGCATANDGSSYFVVQYGELPFGCEFCEWHYLYDQNGKSLTHSQPPILHDRSLPGDDQQHPNNQEFTAQYKALGLSDPSIDFVTCDVRVDARGEPACLKESGDAGQ